MPQLTEALGAVIAALIGAVAVYVSTVLSKEQKTSEFRQEWINAVRDDIATYVSGVSDLYGIYRSRAGDRPLLTTDETKNFNDDFFSEINNINQAGYRIKLRLNRVEHETLIGRLEGLLETIHLKSTSVTGTQRAQFEVAERLVISESQDALKAEWKRVKKGEWTYRIIKWASLILVLTGIYLLSVHTYKNPSLFRQLFFV